MIQDEGNDQGLSANPQQVLRALARELTQPLLYIARQAEFSAEQTTPQADSLLAIERAANGALHLIDSYLLNARSEYGQKQLPLQAVGIGSVLYDVAHSLGTLAKDQGYVIEVDAHYAKPIMADCGALRAALTCLGSLFMSSAGAGEGKDRRLRLMAYKQDATGCMTGVFGAGISLDRRDLVRARRLQGSSHMALSSLSAGSGVHFALADGLANAIGTELRFMRHRGLSGLGMVLSQSQQLQLVTV